VEENEEREFKASNGQSEGAEIDTSGLDPSDEEWEGSMSWQGTKKTVAEEISEVDLASLTDWDD
jgi:hypothetical protein